MRNSEKRVVVTGLGALSPLGNDVQTTWQKAIAGYSGAAEITKFDTTKFKTKFACELKQFDPRVRLDRRSIKSCLLYTSPSPRDRG